MLNALSLTYRFPEVTQWKQTDTDVLMKDTGTLTTTTRLVSRIMRESANGWILIETFFLKAETFR